MRVYKTGVEQLQACEIVGASGQEYGILKKAAMALVCVISWEIWA